MLSQRKTSSSAKKGGIKKNKIIQIQLPESNNKLTRARGLLLLGDIDGNDYKTLKLECEENIVRTEAKSEEIGKTKSTIA
ncbi:hypothetical protein OQZ33_17250 [Pedobacter sp. MC2016-05]|uniref:hypothetical protein n=1 Tax=Pedobacter sp. MC2016-05 TaxID=2994474 RepID=UPI002247A916|nr:hypothetical protein [Pedobacter sp. MC2016-05]MCX2476084.1 hypothetical protein [Pedobacter sp. MC2016-05]